MKFFKNSKGLISAVCLVISMLLCFVCAGADETVALDEVKFVSGGEQIYQKVAGEIKAFAYLSNSDAEAKDVWLIASVYDGNKLSDISIAKKSVPGGAVREKFATDEITVKAGEECKVLVWNEVFSPVCTPVSLSDTSCEKSIDSFALTLGGKTFKGYINSETNVITVPIDTKFINAVATTGITSDNIKDYSDKVSTAFNIEKVEILLGNATPNATFTGTLNETLTAADFSQPVEYTVSAADGTTTKYTVDVDRNIVKYATNFAETDTITTTRTEGERGGMIHAAPDYIGGNDYMWKWYNAAVWDGTNKKFADAYNGLTTNINTDSVTGEKYFTLDATARTTTVTDGDMAFFLYGRWLRTYNNSGAELYTTGYTSHFKVKYDGVTSGVGTLFPSYKDLNGNLIVDGQPDKGIMLYLKANAEGKLMPYLKEGETEIKLSDKTFNQGEWLDIMTTYKINQNECVGEDGNYYNSYMSFYINDEYVGTTEIIGGTNQRRWFDIDLIFGFAHTCDKIKMDLGDCYFSMTPAESEEMLVSVSAEIEGVMCQGLIKDNTVLLEVPTALSSLSASKVLVRTAAEGVKELTLDLSGGTASFTVGANAYTINAVSVTNNMNGTFSQGSFNEPTATGAAWFVSNEKGMTGVTATFSPNLRNAGSTQSVSDGKLLLNKVGEGIGGDMSNVTFPTTDTDVKGFSVSFDLGLSANSVLAGIRPVKITMPDTQEYYFYFSTPATDKVFVDRFTNSSGAITSGGGVGAKWLIKGESYKYTYVYRLSEGVATIDIYLDGRYHATLASPKTVTTGSMGNTTIVMERTPYQSGTITIDNFIYNVIK